MSTKDIQAPRDIPSDVGIVGVGAIAGAIVTGLCEGAGTPTAIHLSPRSAGRASRLATRYPSVHVADSNQTVLARADVVLVCVRPQDAPAALSDLNFRAEQAVISVMAGVPLDALRALVAPAGVLVRAIPLPAVARRSGLTAIHPPTISRWVADRGIPKSDATRYVAAVFASLSETLLVAQPIDLGALADEYATAGGINEQFLTALTRAGTFDTVKRALDDVAVRLEGE